MTPEQLKISILKSAVHGRLTSHEMAEDSDLPIGWRSNKIGKIADVVVGATPSTSNASYWDDGVIPWLPSGSCQNCDVTSAPKYITQQGYDSCSTKMMPPNTVLIALTGATAGKVGFLKFEACGNQSVVGILPSEVMNQKYIYYYLMAERDSILADCVGSAQPHISKAYIVSMEMDVPPLDEQNRIVAKIEELLPCVDRYAEAYEKLEQFNAKFPEDMKKSILQYAIQGKLVEQRSEEGTAEELYQQIQDEKQKLIRQGKIKKEKPLAEITEDEIPFDIPESWKWVRLIDLVNAKPTNGYSPKGVDYETPYRNLTLTATTSGLFKPNCFKYIDITENDAKKYWLKREDILIQRSNSRELVGTCCVYTEEDNQFLYPDLMMRIHLLKNVDVWYVDYVLKSPFVKRYYSNNASGTSDSMPKINQTVVSMTLIPLPPLEEQHRIVAKIEELMPYCDKLTK